MKKRTFEADLAQHPFLKDVDARHVKIITGCVSNVRFAAGSVIFREGEEADKFYVLRSGKVAVEIHAPGRGSITTQTLEGGDILGWSWLVSPYQWRFDARAIEETRAFALDGKCLRKKCEKDHSLGYALLKRFSCVIAERLEATRMQLLDVYSVKS